MGLLHYRALKVTSRFATGELAPHFTPDQPVQEPCRRSRDLPLSLPLSTRCHSFFIFRVRHRKKRVRNIWFKAMDPNILMRTYQPRPNQVAFSFHHDEILG